VKTIADYYFYQIFLIFVSMSGIIPIVAASFTLMRMSRQNELSAILSAGVPLLRMALPIIIAAVVLNGILLVDQEVIVPAMIPKLMRSHNEAGQEAANGFPVGRMQDGKRQFAAGVQIFSRPQGASHAESADRRVQRAELTRCVDYRRPSRLAARINGGQWKLTHAQRLTGLQPGVTPHIDPDYRKPYKSSITPEEIALYRYKIM